MQPFSISYPFLYVFQILAQSRRAGHSFCRLAIHVLLDTTSVARILRPCWTPRRRCPEIPPASGNMIDARLTFRQKRRPRRNSRWLAGILLSIPEIDGIMSSTYPASRTRRGAAGGNVHEVCGLRIRATAMLFWKWRELRAIYKLRGLNLRPRRWSGFRPRRSLHGLELAG